MTISYVKFLKHAAKVTKGVSGARPILTGVCHFEDGSLAVTDSHRLYYATNVIETSKQVVKHPTTGEVIEGNYPEIKRLLPDKDNKRFEVPLNVPETLIALKMMLLVDKKIMVRFTVESHDLMMKVATHSTQVSFNAGGLHDNKKDYSEVNCLVNAKYLLEAFEFFKDLGFYQVVLNFYDNNRPITIGMHDVTALVLPIREKAAVK